MNSDEWIATAADFMIASVITILLLLLSAPLWAAIGFGLTIYLTLTNA